VNIACDAGSGVRSIYARSLRRQTAVERFAPTVLVSAGFDAQEADPIAQMRRTAGRVPRAETSVWPAFDSAVRGLLGRHNVANLALGRSSRRRSKVSLGNTTTG